MEGEEVVSESVTIGVVLGVKRCNGMSTLELTSVVVDSTGTVDTVDEETDGRSNCGETVRHRLGSDNDTSRTGSVSPASEGLRRTTTDGAGASTLEDLPGTDNTSVETATLGTSGLESLLLRARRGSRFEDEKLTRGETTGSNTGRRRPCFSVAISRLIRSANVGW